MTINFGDPIKFNIPISSFPISPLPTDLLANQAAMKVFILKSVHKEMIDHVNQDKNIECGGVLIGHPFQDRKTKDVFIVIVGCIPDLSTNRSAVHFTVTPEEISKTREVLEKNFGGLISVGWYHSHPGHGIFLSGQDMTIVNGIYNEAWDIAWVIDPINNLEGVFYGSEGNPLIKNKSSFSLLEKGRVWFGLDEYPSCIKDIQITGNIAS